MCYLYGQKGLRYAEKLKTIRNIKTSDSTFLFRYKSPVSDTTDYRIKPDNSLLYHYTENALALIRPNQKGEILDKEFK